MNTSGVFLERFNHSALTVVRLNVVRHSARSVGVNGVNDRGAHTNEAKSGLAALSASLAHREPLRRLRRLLRRPSTSPSPSPMLLLRRFLISHARGEGQGGRKVGNRKRAKVRMTISRRAH